MLHLTSFSRHTLSPSLFCLCLCLCHFLLLTWGFEKKYRKNKKGSHGRGK
ncbi:hypothetical protein CORC01_04479 [Colletotrichum orchidophilum]|uniref:Uncharacterized protein n=1 Tax=Colletotrichum orchidophilum TaxID=1209926 RepID=A0A1G4BFK8_9PEZI|nr:uncharacterized protein CORC01_04479 [Colletotrichum orchidophilum]OHF00290.1 hypothetical protein CORC01_04479 [Colletotrichum orchidophilum]